MGVTHSVWPYETVHGIGPVYPVVRETREANRAVQVTIAYFAREDDAATFAQYKNISEKLKDGLRKEKGKGAKGK